MPSAQRPADVIVVGGGIIGLSVAWRLGASGRAVTLLERERAGGGTSRVAAGMLAPVAEAEFGPGGRRLLELGLRSSRMWPPFAAELERAAGMSVELLQTGTLVVARDDDEAHALERQLAFREELGLRVRRLRPSEAREREPALAPTIRLALEAPDDHSVDPRRVLEALARACARAGVQLRENARVERVERGGEGAGAVTLHDGTRLRARETVLAAGAWSSEIGGLPAGCAVPIRPVRGQILRLRDPAGPGLLRRVLRFEGGYLVPRADGRYVLGATVEERGFARLPTAGGVYELLRDAHELIPGVAELEIEELSVGFRPGTPDNAPVIGRAPVAGLTWATGHHRNGILLAPLTAELVHGVLSGAPAGLDGGALAACDPGRFAPAAARAHTAPPADPVGAAR